MLSKTFELRDYSPVPLSLFVPSSFLEVFIVLQREGARLKFLLLSSTTTAAEDEGNNNQRGHVAAAMKREAQEEKAL